jgi:hypothetical protein
VYVADDEDVVDASPVQDAVADPPGQADDAAGGTPDGAVSPDAPGDGAAVRPESVDEQPIETPSEPAAPEAARPDLSGLNPAQLRELNPELAKALENAGAQSREAQLRREAGSRENTRTGVERTLRAVGVDPDSVPDKSGFDLLYANAHGNAHDAVMRAVAENVRSAFGADPVAAAAIDAGMERTGDELTKFSEALFSAAVDAEARRRVTDTKLADVPQGTQLTKDIEAEITRRVDLEVKAAGIESRPRRQPAPNTVEGRPPTAEADRSDPVIQKLRSQGVRNLSAEERERAEQILGLTRN